MSALACLAGWVPEETRLRRHVVMEMALAEVTRRRAAGVPAAQCRGLQEDWPTYFRRLHQEKVAKDQGEAELVAGEPEHTSRDPWPEGFAVPRAAASLVKVAEAAGWLTRVQYARGSVVCRRKGEDGTMGRLVERRHSVAVRCWHPVRQLHAVALWEAPVEAEKLAWKADMGKVWAVGQLPHEVGVTALTATVKGESGS